ncbi:MAG: cytidylate kinase family protein [Proteobacteria bacterium]|jgi:hypothetical protein|nr:cytidylate kinase family protein [Pseudomonadota bacterium]
MAILTISREFGSGGREIGRADAMGYDYVDRNRVLEDMSREGKVWEEKAKLLTKIIPISGRETIGPSEVLWCSTRAISLIIR